MGVWDHSSFLFNLVQLIQILSVQLIQILYTHLFSAVYIFGSLYFRCSLIDQATYSFGGSIQSIKSFDEDLRREYSKWVSEINILLIQIVYCLLALLFVSVVFQSRIGFRVKGEHA
jgi:hypothetical protein